MASSTRTPTLETVGAPSPQGGRGPGRVWLTSVPLVLVRKGTDGTAELVLLDHGLYQFLDEK